MPFVLHVGGQPIQIRAEYMNTGRPVPTDWLGGGENVRGKDIAVLHHSSEEFLSAMVLDGVLERHPDLRGGAIELGATWVPGLLRRLDHAVDIWARSEPELGAFTRKPSEQVRQQLAFTPYVFEDVGKLIAESSDDLYLFSSDYPHPEGGRNPLGRFEASLGDVPESVREPLLRRQLPADPAVGGGARRGRLTDPFRRAARRWRSPRAHCCRADGPSPPRTPRR